MQLTLDELNRFHRFAEETLANGNGDLTLEDLVEMWSFENPSPERQHEDLLAVKAALRDVDNGDRGIPFEDHIRELREKYGLAEE